MLEKIKKLLDSWCWVEVKCDKWTITFIAHDSEYEFANSRNNKHLYSQIEKREIFSIKPIARPLYQYKVGDKVVVLENYEGKYLIFWEIVEITNIWNGTIEVEKNKDIYSIDTRCIAPVLD